MSHQPFYPPFCLRRGRQGPRGRPRQEEVLGLPGGPPPRQVVPGKRIVSYPQSRAVHLVCAHMIQFKGYQRVIYSVYFGGFYLS